jgi:hypothetical protein
MAGQRTDSAAVPDLSNDGSPAVNTGVFMTGSIWTDVLLFVAFISLLSVGVFRLDTIMSTSRPKREKSSPTRKFCGSDESGKIVLIDPDGRAVRRKRRA